MLSTCARRLPFVATAMPPTTSATALIYEITTTTVTCAVVVVVVSISGITIVAMGSGMAPTPLGW